MTDQKEENERDFEAGIAEDEIFLDELKDSFCFFFAATVAAMETLKYFQLTQDDRPVNPPARPDHAAYRQHQASGRI